jgi:hypothetical protein
MRRLVACIMLACLGLSATLPGLCAAAVPEDTAGGHAAHGGHGGHEDPGGHAAHVAHHEASGAASHAEPEPGAGHHHDDCALMVRCHWTALASPAAPVAFVAPHTAEAMPAMYTTRAPPVRVIDTPPPRTVS